MIKIPKIVYKGKGSGLFLHSKVLVFLFLSSLEVVGDFKETKFFKHTRHKYI